MKFPTRIPLGLTSSLIFRDEGAGFGFFVQCNTLGAHELDTGFDRLPWAGSSCGRVLGWYEQFYAAGDARWV